MLGEFDRVLKPDGSVILLSARKAEYEAAVRRTDFVLRKRYDTLVNGKKAAVYLMNKRGEDR